MRGQYEFDRQVEQRTEAFNDIVARHVLAIGDPDVQTVAEVGERVAGDGSSSLTPTLLRV